MFKVRTLLAIVVVAVVISAQLEVRASDPSRFDADSVAVRLPDDFEAQLNAVLKSRRPVEFEFVAKIVTMVEQDRLPLDLVQSTFDWVRKKKDCEYPFVFFERALRVRAAKLGIVIPEVPTP